MLAISDRFPRRANIVLTSPTRCRDGSTQLPCVAGFVVRRPPTRTSWDAIVTASRYVYRRHEDERPASQPASAVLIRPQTCFYGPGSTTRYCTRPTLRVTLTRETHTPHVTSGCYHQVPLQQTQFYLCSHIGEEDEETKHGNMGNECENIQIARNSQPMEEEEEVVKIE